jgi:hypothetical protein
VTPRRAVVDLDDNTFRNDLIQAIYQNDVMAFLRCNLPGHRAFNKDFTTTVQFGLFYKWSGFLVNEAGDVLCAVGTQFPPRACTSPLRHLTRYSDDYKFCRMTDFRIAAVARKFDCHF